MLRLHTCDVVRFGFLALVPALAHAQASISGVVRDASGAVLPGVTVEASSPALIEKVRSVVDRRQRPVPHRRSSAGHLCGDVHPAAASPLSGARASS